MVLTLSASVVLLLLCTFVLMAISREFFRGLMGWIFVPIATPLIFIRTRYRLGKVFVQAELKNLRIAPRPLEKFSNYVEDFKNLGFHDQGIYLAERLDGFNTSAIQILSHDASSTYVFVIAETWGRVSMVRVALQIRGDLELLTTTEAIPRPHRDPHEWEWFVPSLKEAADLWRVHQSLLNKYNITPLPCPLSREKWCELLDSDKDQFLFELRDRGFLQFDQSQAIARFTLRGALRLAKNQVWPWELRRRQILLERETRLLTECGLNELLQSARTPPPASPIISTLRGDLPDDRGKVCRTATLSTLRSDDRASDPVLQALLARAQREGSQAFVEYGTGAQEFVRAPLISNGLCPSCLYGLSPDAIESDGCIPCPECGAAWKRSRIHEFRSFGSRP